MTIPESGNSFYPREQNRAAVENSAGALRTPGGHTGYAELRYQRVGSARARGARLSMLAGAILAWGYAEAVAKIAANVGGQAERELAVLSGYGKQDTAIERRIRVVVRLKARLQTDEAHNVA